MWIDEQDVSGVTEVDIAWGDQAFEQVFLLCDSIQPSVDNVSFVIRTSSDNGANFDAGANQYQSANHSESGPTGFFNQGGASRIQLAPEGGQSTIYRMDSSAWASFFTTIDQPYDTTLKTVVRTIGGYRASTLGQHVTVLQHGYRDVAGRVNAVRYLPNTGTFSGRFQAWGLVL